MEIIIRKTVRLKEDLQYILGQGYRAIFVQGNADLVMMPDLF